MAPVCKFYLEGKCQRGSNCKFSHTGHPISLATAIKQPEPVPEFADRTIVAVLGAPGIRAVFGDGVVPVAVNASYVGRGVQAFGLLQSALRVTWYRSTCPAWLCFDTEAKARSAVETLNGREVEHARLEAMLLINKPPKHICVQVNGIPSHIGPQVLKDLLGPEKQPDNLSFGRATYPPDTSGVNIFRKYIEERTKARIFCEKRPEKENPAKECVDFVFEGTPDLEPITLSLHERTIPKLGHTKAYATAHVGLGLHVKKAAYAMKRQQLNAIAVAASSTWQVSVRRSTLERDEHHIIVHLWATQRECLALVKNQIENLFNQDDSIFALVKHKASKQTHRIQLTKTTAYKQAVENIDTAQKEFGKDVVALDNESKPTAILVKGDSSVLRSVKKHFPGDKPTGVSKKVSCDICLDDDINDIVKIDGCGHLVCLECVRHLFMTPTDAKFPLHCFKVDCNQKISSRQVYDLLTQDELVHVLRDSVLDHFRRHPNEFGQCPGSECTKWYHKSEEVDRPRRCSGCLTLFCAHCDVEYHDRESCKEYQERIEAEERDIRRYMEQTGAKRCPGCRTIVHKIAGCNNMDCGACRAHFCWFCLWVGPTHDAVYGHMSREHDDWFDDPREAWNNILAGMGPEEAAANGLMFRPAAGNGILFQQPAPQDAEEAFRRVDMPLAAPNPPPLRQIPHNVAGRHRPLRERPQPPAQLQQNAGLQRPDLPANVDPADLQIPREAAEAARQARNLEIDRMRDQFERDMARLRLEIPALPPFVGFPRQVQEPAQAAGQPRPRVAEHRPFHRNRQRQEAPAVEQQFMPRPQQGFMPGLVDDENRPAQPRPQPQQGFMPGLQRDENRLAQPAVRWEDLDQQEFERRLNHIRRLNEQGGLAAPAPRQRERQAQQGPMRAPEQRDVPPAPVPRMQFGELDVADDHLAEQMRRVALRDNHRA